MPDNNTAERALRHRVNCRKTTGATDNERGSRFVGQIRGVVATCRQSGLGYLTEPFNAHIAVRPARR